MKPRLFAALPAFILALGFSSAASADTLTFTLTNPTQSVLPGDTVSYSGTITAAATNTGLEYLNGDAFSVASPLTLNDASFFAGVPLDLGAGASYTGVLFTVSAPLSSSLSTFGGSFSLLGGSTNASYSILATQTFSTTVTAAAATTPEPSSWALLATGLVGAFVVTRRTRATSAIVVRC